MREVGGAVERIDVPAVFRCSLVRAAFFGDNRVAWEELAQALDDQVFAGAIGFGDQIVGAFQLKTDAAAREFIDAGTGLAGNRGGNFDKSFQVFFQFVKDYVNS